MSNCYIFEINLKNTYNILITLQFQSTGGIVIYMIDLFIYEDWSFDNSLAIFPDFKPFSTQQHPNGVNNFAAYEANSKLTFLLNFDLDCYRWLRISQCSIMNKFT